MLTVEKNVKMPEMDRKWVSREECRETISAMAIGDSVVVPGAASDNSAAYFRAIARESGAKVKCRTQEDGTTRIWRIA